MSHLRFILMLVSALSSGVSTAADGAMTLTQVVGWEASGGTDEDIKAVACVVLQRMVCRRQSLAEVIYAPGQFEVVGAGLVGVPPPRGERVRAIVLSVLADPSSCIEADHFISPPLLEARGVQVPSWARDEWRVDVEGAIQWYYLLPGCEGGGFTEHPSILGGGD